MPECEKYVREKRVICRTTSAQWSGFAADNPGDEAAITRISNSDPLAWDGMVGLVNACTLL